MQEVGSYVYWVYISLMEGIHVPVWEQAIGEERQQDEFGKSKQLIA